MNPVLDSFFMKDLSLATPGYNGQEAGLWRGVPRADPQRCWVRVRSGPGQRDDGLPLEDVEERDGDLDD